MFSNYDPATTVLWHDMRGDFPQGGYTVGYTHHQGTLYALWGIGHMYAHTIYLLRIQEDQAGNFVSYTNLGDVESRGIPEGGWDLISDGQDLYIVSPQALYQVDLSTTPPTFTRIYTFDLHPGEQVAGGTAQWADLEILFATAPSWFPVGKPQTLTITVRNHGPYTAERVNVRVALPANMSLLQAQPDQGTYDPGQHIWEVGALSPGQKAHLHLTFRLSRAGSYTIQAHITHSSTLDPDSVARIGFDVDDHQDGRPDDDEARLTWQGIDILPSTGFPPGRNTPLAQAQQTPQQNLDLVLDVPRLQIRAPIVGVPLTASGWDVTWLGNAVGWLHGTAFPTWPGNTVLTAHAWDPNGTPGIFHGLERLRYGDRVHLIVGGKRVAYMVVSNEVVPEDAVNAVLAPAQEDLLTLLTCTAFDETEGRFLARRVVRAVRIAEP